MRLLINAGGKLPLQIMGEKIMNAIKKDDDKIITRMLNLGYPINVNLNPNGSWLHVAVANKAKKITKLLIDRGIDKTKKDKFDDTAYDIVKKKWGSWGIKNLLKPEHQTYLYNKKYDE